MVPSVKVCLNWNKQTYLLNDLIRLNLFPTYQSELLRMMGKEDIRGTKNKNKSADIPIPMRWMEQKAFPSPMQWNYTPHSPHPLIIGKIRIQSPIPRNAMEINILLPLMLPPTLAFPTPNLLSDMLVPQCLPSKVKALAWRNVSSLLSAGRN